MSTNAYAKVPRDREVDPGGMGTAPQDGWKRQSIERLSRSITVTRRRSCAGFPDNSFNRKTTNVAASLVTCTIAPGKTLRA